MQEVLLFTTLPLTLSTVTSFVDLFTFFFLFGFYRAAIGNNRLQEGIVTGCSIDDEGAKHIGIGLKRIHH